MDTVRKAWEWALEDDWRWIRCFIAAQIIFVGGFLWFAMWISEYARLNWH